MKIIEAKAEILRPVMSSEAIDAIYRNIEIAGRTCYKSEDKITPESSRKFVRSFVAYPTRLFGIELQVSHKKVQGIATTAKVNLVTK